MCLLYTGLWSWSSSPEEPYEIFHKWKSCFSIIFVSFFQLECELIKESLPVSSSVCYNVIESNEYDDYKYFCLFQELFAIGNQ